MKKLFLGLSLFLFAFGVGALNPSKVSAQLPALLFGSNAGVPDPIKSTSGALWVSITGGTSTLSTISATDTNGIAVKTYLNTIDGTSFTPVLAGAGAGNVDNGTHSYKFTLTDVNGETTVGAATPTVTVTDKTVNGKVTVKLPLLSNTSQINSLNIYRTKAGGSTYFQLTQNFSLNVSTYTDNTADASLTTAPPSTNTAFGTRYTFLGEWLTPTISTGSSNIPEGAVLLLGDPRSDSQLQNAIAVHDAFSPTGRGVELDLYAGNSVGGTAGALTINGGASSGAGGGQVTISGGAGSTGSNSGKVVISSANKIEVGATTSGVKITDSGSGYGTLDVGTLLIQGVSDGCPCGIWTANPFSAGDYTATGGTWTVGSGDVLVAKYSIVNKTMSVMYRLTTTTVGSTPTILSIAIPASKTAATAATSACLLFDNSTTVATPCRVDVQAGVATIQIRTANVGSFTTSTDNTSVFFEFFFEIQ